MLSESEISEIRAHLQNAQNPLFFFDNDADGLCSFLILRRAIGRGRGVAIKSFPELHGSYIRKVHELNPDYVFILDKPLVSDEFLKGTEELNLPVVWIDHHDVPVNPFGKLVHYYNCIKSSKPTSEPVTYWAYKVAGRKEDLWLGLSGCIADGFLPADFSKDAEKAYPELWRPVKSAFEGVYSTEIGRMTRILNFALKDRTSNVVKMLKFLFSANPADILSESKKNSLLERFYVVDSRYRKLIEKAKEDVSGEKMLFFQYGGELSLSADIANELFYTFPDKLVVVAYLTGPKVNFSLRGNMDVRDLTLKSIEGIEGARGGGHKNATGAQVLIEDLPKFRENLANLLK